MITQGWRSRNHLGGSRPVSKYATFIASPQNISAEDTSRLFFSHIVKYWGLPKDIISECDSRFTSKFWTHLFRSLESKLSPNSNFHQQEDGQTEWFNDMLEEYLCHFATESQKNWVKLLDAAQLCFNSQKQQPLLSQTVNAPNMPILPQAVNFGDSAELSCQGPREGHERPAAGNANNAASTDNAAHTDHHVANSIARTDSVVRADLMPSASTQPKAYPNSVVCTDSNARAGPDAQDKVAAIGLDSTL
nr:uncharacterized protein LOC104102528 [Nicotiana tomentosiformis]